MVQLQLKWRESVPHAGSAEPLGGLGSLLFRPSSYGGPNSQKSPASLCTQNPTSVYLAVSATLLFPEVEESLMVFVGQVGMFPTRKETVRVGGPFTIHRGHSLPTSASPVMNRPGIHLGSPTPAPAVCAGQMSPPLWAPGPSLTQKNQASVYPTVKWEGGRSRGCAFNSAELVVCGNQGKS